MIKQWYTSAQANCNSTTCFVTPATALADGEYSWKVMTYTSAGDGPWSESTNFAVGQAEPTLVGPQGDIGRNYNPTYTWNKVTDLPGTSSSSAIIHRHGGRVVTGMSWLKSATTRLVQSHLIPRMAERTTGG